jgi:hypothetical protein
MSERHYELTDETIECNGIILHRIRTIVDLPQYDVKAGDTTNISVFTDANTISDYAVTAMKYVVGNGFIKGKTETTLNPANTATRAEMATILQRFIEGNK